ncbi:MAG: hypothetical protein LWW77_11235 [Propionibacteriales bacterium]|nr:hypothetical protein [Propionibacteriales bacterium]
MKRNGALQIIFAFFLGLVLVAFVWIGVITFYPEPSWDGSGSSRTAWQLMVGIILLVTATVVLAISLALPVTLEAIANGLLLGGVFTMISAVAMALSSESGPWRFAVVTAALAVTIGIGYLRFGRGPRAVPAATAASGGAGDPQLTARVEQLEHRLEAIRRALD